MIFYVLRHPVTVETERVSKTIPGAGNFKNAPISAIQISSHQEITLVREQISTRYGAEALDQIQILEDAKVAQWPNFPCRLGRKSLGLTGRGKECDCTAENAPLSAQLRQLRALHPRKMHFRIALVNGFGGNLGDNLIGTTALRQVVKVLAKGLPSFSIDCLFLTGTNPANREFVKAVPEVEQVFFTGLSLDEFGLDDAYFDFDSFVDNPRYAELPPVDFCLWWMGLDPEKIPGSEKRNQITIEREAWPAVSALLGGAASPRVFLSHRASVPLRSLPEPWARQLVTTLLDTHPELTVILDAGLGINHPRLRDLSGKIDSIEKLKALIAQVDGVISVDSLTQHIADACATPTVLLSSSLPITHFPYYPHMKALTPPGAEKLSGWGKTKVDSETWPAMANDYAQAWAALPIDAAWAALQERMDCHSASLSAAPAQCVLTNPAQRPPWITLQQDPQGGLQIRPKYQVQDTLREQVEGRVAAIARALLKPGQTMVHAGAADGELTTYLAEYTYPRGEIHAFEPRRLYFQALCANAALAGLDKVFAYPDLPTNYAETPDDSSRFHALDAFSSHDPGLQGNSHGKVVPSFRSIDSLKLASCRLLLIQPPMPLDAVLAGAFETLRQCHPIVIAGPLPPNVAASLSQSLVSLNYARWQVELSAGPKENALLLVALPQESTIRMTGFTRLDGNGTGL